jgi:hypothetical protein
MRCLLALAFVLSALLPGALGAQQSTSSSSSSSHSSTTKSSSNSKSSTTSKNAANNKYRKNHGQNPWSRNVLINAGSASQYLTASPPPKPPPKNKVNSGGEVFKSIGN